MQMVAGGRQQAAGVEQIAVAMQKINQATVRSLSSTRQAEKAAQNLNELAFPAANGVGVKPVEQTIGWS
jgi:methyl-accepting chemotaxis protein